MVVENHLFLRVSSAAEVREFKLIGVSLTKPAGHFYSGVDSDAVTQFFIGLIYDNGEGVPENNAEAMKWFRKAAEQGHADAQSYLGLMYTEYTGVPEDYVKTYMCLSLASAQGDKGAARNLDIIKRQMTPEDISKTQALASEWWEKHNN